MNDDVTIDTLAQAAGIPVSTVRMYQNRGLLAPPTKRGRVGYYDAAHLARLNLIAQLQERGFSLAAIKELVDGMEKGDSLRGLLGLDGGPTTWAIEESVRMRLADLVEFLPGVELTQQLMERVIDLGLVERLDGTTDVLVHSPSFLRIGSQLAGLGVPGEEILDQYQALREDTTRIANRFTEVFRDHMWAPLVAEGVPTERVSEMIRSLEQLGPLAEGVVVMALRHSLQELAETFIRSEAARLGIEIPRPGE